MFNLKATFSILALISTISVNAAPAPFIKGNEPEIQSDLDTLNEELLVERGNLTRRYEYHSVNLINRCGSGEAVFIYQDNDVPQGTTAVPGPLKGGVAWVAGIEEQDCQLSGVNCGIVEFTLTNPDVDSANTLNSADYSLNVNGNHQFTYPMDFHYIGGCDESGIGACVAGDQCPGVAWGFEGDGAYSHNCEGYDVGIEITFC